MKKLLLLSVVLASLSFTALNAQGVKPKPKPKTLAPAPSAVKPNPAVVPAFPVTTTIATTATFNPKSAVLVKKVEAEPGKLIIPYTKYKLHNGLTVLINEDHSDPIVHVEVTYHVGSNRETVKRTGFAHFFEHMMFQGSVNVNDEEHFKIVQESGGQMNGTTNRDRTNYFETMPSNMLETALWLEADRMGFLLPAYTTKKFEVQRSTVKNEKDERYADGFGMLPEVQDETLYPYGHPYSWQTIGYIDDLDSAKSEDLEIFFKRFYGPNNATLVISGDVNTEEAIKMVERYFNAINRGAEVPPLEKKPANLTESKIRSFEAKVDVPYTSITYPSVPSFHADEPALDILGQLLSGSRSSLMYRKFIENEFNLQAQCFNSSAEIAGEFNFGIVTYPTKFGGLTERDIRDTLKEVFSLFEKEGITDGDLERVKKGFVTSYYGILETVASKSTVLSIYEYLLPGRDFNLQNDIDRYQKVTKQDVMRVFKKYLKDKNFVSVTIAPDRKYVEDYTAKIEPYKSINPYLSEKIDNFKYKNTFYKAPLEIDGFDRKIHPTIAASKPAVAPAMYNINLENGVKIIGTSNKETPRTTLMIDFRGGHLFETGKIKNGTAAFLAGLMNEGTKSVKVEELDRKLADLGSSVSFNGGGNLINCFATFYADKMKETMAILEDMLMNPSFDEKAFKKDKKSTLQGIAQSNRTPTSFGSKKFKSMLLGSENPIGVNAASDYKAFKSITMQDLKYFYTNFITSNLTNVVIVGEVSEATAKENLAFLNKLPNKNLTLPVFTVFPEAQKTKIYLVNQDYAKQSNIAIGYRSMAYDVYDDFFKATIANYAFGGNFNSRLNLKLREDKGWTYGVNSGFRSNGYNNPSVFTISGGFKTLSTDSAISEILIELKKYIELGITDEELAFTKRSLIGSDALKYESPGDKLGFLSTIITLNIDKNFNDKRAEIVKNITKEEVNTLIKKYFNVDTLLIMVVGDDLKVIDGLNKLGLGKVEVLEID
ncbi:MAG: insulinase family protein [Bacteroidetes bacterium]|nr:insulinase family protein [Bacteroidota bacterium]